MSIKTLGLRHVALNIFDLESCVKFYIEIFGMKVEWQPDDDNFYLTSGKDNLALHRTTKTERDRASQRLDHIGFIVKTPEEVDRAFQLLLEHKIDIVAPPKTHRDNARSLYCKDPDGNVVQVIYHPPISH
ncbi:MAG: glyoxalase [Gammaproteobacteria bacterium RIFCSPHIGHO2_12_FULL_38_11]|nr:MAG: glyoxalase [Gammaproteobacteria bacterium RIFCSPHIGHO2_12_FULL_38_11]